MARAGVTDIPPPRYRIVERKGKIVVTDTWAKGDRPTLPPSPAPGKRRSARSTVLPAALGKLRIRLVSLACLGASDDAGNPILTTHYHFDEKGPRSIVPSEAGARRLGNWLLGVASIVGLLLLGFVFTPFAALLAVGAAGLAFTSANTTARPAITRWLDGLGAKLP